MPCCNRIIATLAEHLLSIEIDAAAGGTASLMLLLRGFRWHCATECQVVRFYTECGKIVCTISCLTFLRLLQRVVLKLGTVLATILIRVNCHLAEFVETYERMPR